MKLTAIGMVSVACVAALGAGQVALPTARAQPAPPTAEPVLPPAYSVRLEAVRVKRAAGSLEITGRILNTGRGTLTYTSVAAVLTSAAGVELGRGAGYLTTGPVAPGQTAEVRACAAFVPAFAKVTLLLRERGQAVSVHK